MFRLIVLLWSLAAGPVEAQDWTQWRGPSRDGSLTQDPFTRWPSAFTPAWRIEVGEGYASPVVAGGLVYVHSRRDPQETVTAVDLATGRIKWQRTYDAPYQKNQYAVRMAKGPHATPLIVAGRVFALGVTGILTVWDATTGRPLWWKDFSQTVDSSKLFCGTAASPLWVAGTVVVQVGSDLHGGRIMALDPATGTIRWVWQGAGPGYASPILITIAGSKQIVTLTEGSVIGLEPSTGRELWSAPFPDEWHENIVTPVWTGRHLVVSSRSRGTRAFTVSRSSDTWKATEAWANTDVTMYMSTPVYGDGLLYGFSNKQKGQFVALDASTGTLKWATDGRQGDHASLLLTPRHVLALTNGGDLTVALRATPTFEVSKRYEVSAAETWAVPVFRGGELIVRDAQALIKLTPASER